MRSGSATELSAYTYQRAIKLTPFAAEACYLNGASSSPAIGSDDRFWQRNPATCEIGLARRRARNSRSKGRSVAGRKIER